MENFSNALLLGTEPFHLLHAFPARNLREEEEAQKMT